MRILFLTALALISFAANSLLARAALSPGDTGPIAFTLIRLWTGAAALYALLAVTGQLKSIETSRNWAGAGMLLLYALMFSLAYVSLDTGTGALALFATVQLTILGVAAYNGRLQASEAVGAALAFAGFVYLVWPNLGTPGVFGLAAMVLSGIGWGAYTLLGRGAHSPLALTAENFLRASLLSTLLVIGFALAPEISLRGATYAALSGAVTSGCGYAIWYGVLPRLSTATSGVSQLLVPPLAAILGWLVLAEAMAPQALVATGLILGGVLIVILGPRLSVNNRP